MLGIEITFRSVALLGCIHDFFLEALRASLDTARERSYTNATH